MAQPAATRKLKVLVFAASLRADSLNRKLAALAARVANHAEAAKLYPCMKRAWVEFLGEPPGTGADRVDPVSP